MKNKTPEQTCKFCGGFLTLFKCQNPPCKLYGKGFRASHKTTFCRACDKLLARKAITNPCPDCLKNRPDSILKRFEQRDKDALKAELGYPLDDKDYTVSEDASELFGKEWQGYTLEIYGVIAGRYSETTISDEHLELMEKVGALKRLEGNRVTIKAWGLFPFTCIPHLEDSDLIVRLCRMRAFFEGSPLYSEMRAHPYGVRRVAIHGLEYKHTKKDLERAVKGLALLHRVEKLRGGRPPGSTKPAEKKAQDAAEFTKKIEEAVRSLFKASGKMPTKTAVAEALGMGGINPHKGSDTRLNSFNNKLSSRKIDYDAIVQRLNLHE